ncbi:hypothetical protein I4U23_004348 [Adineta vaga]|nr:hypothetical protein I4U23_004348 [Adineta vaga]
MSKKFRCGRLLLTRDGRIKKLDLGNGGGTRICDWPDDSMTLDGVHNRLLAVFSSIDKKHQTSLYDFQHQPLDIQQFKTFTDYMNKYGLNRNSTVVYLCTSEFINEIPKSKEIELESLSITQSKSSSDYSFINTSNDLMNNIRELMNQHPSDKILINLFENLCLIHGYVYSIILPLQQLSEQSNESEITLYLNNLNNIYEIFQSTKLLLHDNIVSFCQTKLFPITRSLFFQFHNNIKILRNRWSKYVEKKNQVNTSITLSDTETDSQEKSFKQKPRKQIRKQRGKNFILFRSILKWFHYLVRVLKNKRLPLFRLCVTHAIEKVKSLQIRINLSDEASICQAKKVIESIKNQLNRKYHELEIDSTGSEPDPAIHKTQSSTMRVIRATLTSLYRYQTKISPQNQEKTD